MTSYELYEASGEYSGKNMIDVTVSDEDGDIYVDATLGTDYFRVFGEGSIPGWRAGDPVVSLLLSEHFGFTEDYSRDFLLKRDTPRKFNYLLERFYVTVKPKLVTAEEKEFFRGMGFSILCWYMKKMDEESGSDLVLILEAFDSPTVSKQEKLVAYYEKIGFATCSSPPSKTLRTREYFYSGMVCMYALVKDFLGGCRSRFKEVEV